MPGWPWLVALVLLAVSRDYALMAHSIAPPSAYTQQVQGLSDYCSEIEATLDGNAALHASAVGPVTSALTMTSSIYSNYASGPGGNPAYTLQCWINTPIPAAQAAQSIAAGAKGNLLVGTAGSTTQWVPAVQGIGLASQTLPYSLSTSQVGTVVILTGY